MVNIVLKIFEERVSLDLDPSLRTHVIVTSSDVQKLINCSVILKRNVPIICFHQLLE